MSTGQVATRLSCFALISAIDWLTSGGNAASSPKALYDRKSYCRRSRARSEKWTDDHESIQDQGADRTSTCSTMPTLPTWRRPFIYSKTTLLRLKTLDVRPIAMLLESLAPARNRAPLEQILPQSAPGSAIVSLAWRPRHPLCRGSVVGCARALRWLGEGYGYEITADRRLGRLCSYDEGRRAARANRRSSRAHRRTYSLGSIEG